MFKRFYAKLYQFCGNSPTREFIGEVTSKLISASIIRGLLALLPSGLLPITPSVTCGTALLLNAVVLFALGVAATDNGSRK